MRRVTVLLIALMALAMTAGPASASRGGVSPEKLQKAGWTCFTEVPAVVHCVKDLEALLAGDPVTATILTFDAETGEFLGTELLIHRDHYHGQPCPQDEVAGGDGSYVDLAGMGLDYFVCHHFESPVT